MGEQRVVLKLSGQALAGKKEREDDVKYGVDPAMIDRICGDIVKASQAKKQIALIVGGGNIWRGREHRELESTRSDQVGMLATVMNSLVLADALEKRQLDVRVQSAIAMPTIAETYVRNRAVRHLEAGRIVIIACGTGNPFFSTDTASVLRCLELNADCILKATLVDGVYDKDPNEYPDAVKYARTTFSNIIDTPLTKIFDATAATMCRERGLTLRVFNIFGSDTIYRAIMGEEIGTIVKE